MESTAVNARDCFESYLSGRTQYAIRSSRLCQIFHQTTRLGRSARLSILGPILFIRYTADPLRIMEPHCFQTHMYADDTQLIGSCRPRDTIALLIRVPGRGRFVDVV